MLTIVNCDDGTGISIKSLCKNSEKKNNVHSQRPIACCIRISKFYKRDITVYYQVILISFDVKIFLFVVYNSKILKKYTAYSQLPIVYCIRISQFYKHYFARRFIFDRKFIL